MAIDDREATVIGDNFEQLVSSLLENDPAFRLTEEQQRKHIVDLLAGTLATSLKKRAERRQPVNGADFELKIIAKLRALFAQRIALFEAQLRAASKIANVTAKQRDNLRAYTASCYVVVHDTENNRLFWAGAGDASPLLVSMTIPEADRRASLFDRFASRLKTLALAAQTRGQHASIDSLVNNLLAHRNNARLFIAETNVQSRLDLLSRTLVDLDAQLKKDRALPHNTDAEKLKRNAQIERTEAAKRRTQNLINFLLYIQLGESLRSDNNNSALFEAILRSTPEFKGRVTGWNTSFGALSVAMSVLKNSYAKDETFKKILTDALDIGKMTDASERIYEARQRYYLLVGSSDITIDIDDDAEEEWVLAFAKQNLGNGISLQALLTAQATTASNLRVQLAFHSRQIPEYERYTIESVLQMINNPREMSFMRSQELVALLETLEERKSLAKDTLYTYLQAQTNATGGSRLVIVQGDVDQVGWPAFVHDSAADATMESLTELLLREVIQQDTDGKFAELLHRSSSNGNDFLVAPMTLTPKRAGELWSEYQTTPRAFMSKTFRLVEIPSTAPQNGIVIASSGNDAVVGRAQLTQTLMQIVRKTRFYMAELQYLEVPIVEPESKGKVTKREEEAIETQAVRAVTREIELQADRMKLDSMVNLDVDAFDPRETEDMDSDQYHLWRSSARPKLTRWPVLDLFAYGQAMADRELKTGPVDATTRQNLENASDAHYRDYRILAERRLHTIGAAYLKDAEYRISRSLVADLLVAEGVPHSQAFAQAWLYDEGWTNANTMPLVEASPYENARAGVVHLDQSVAFMVCGSERFHEALRVDKAFVGTVMKQYTRAYFGKLRQQAITNVITEMRTRGWVYGSSLQQVPTLERSVNVKQSIKRNRLS